jgi:hypothetical protein
MTDRQTEALIRVLPQTIDDDRYPLSPRVGRRRPHPRNHRGLRRGFSEEYEADAQSQSLDLGKPSPHATFTAVVYGENRAKFRTPETSLRGKRICVTGKISDYQGKREIVLTEPRQLSQ